jgi:hypothetical protein
MRFTTMCFSGRENGIGSMMIDGISRGRIPLLLDLGRALAPSVLGQLSGAWTGGEKEGEGLSPHEAANLFAVCEC